LTTYRSIVPGRSSQDRFGRPTGNPSEAGQRLRVRVLGVSSGEGSTSDPFLGGSDGGVRGDDRPRGRRRAAAIYGTIVTAAVLAAGGNQLSSAVLEVTVLVTLIVYWLAEQYAELLGEHTGAGRLPTRNQVRSSLAEAWPMVTASFVPLLSLLAARLLGASPPGAADVALIVTLALLVIHGYAAGRAAHLTGVRLVIVVAVAGLLGAAMVVLKAVVTH
jgi:hypothetical protein